MGVSAAPPGEPPHVEQCIAYVAERYGAPEGLLRAILSKEGGRDGDAIANNNGSFDLGRSQINTAWLPTLHRFGITKQHLQHNACTNIGTQAWILSNAYVEKGSDWFRATVAYHIGSNKWSGDRLVRGHCYAVDTFRRWYRIEARLADPRLQAEMDWCRKQPKLVLAPARVKTASIPEKNTATRKISFNISGK